MQLELRTKPREIAVRWVRAGDEVAMMRQPADDGAFMLPVRSVEVAALDEHVAWCLVVGNPVPVAEKPYGTRVLNFAQLNDDGTAGPVAAVWVREGEQLVVREALNFDDLTNPVADVVAAAVEALVAVTVEQQTLAEGQPETAGITAESDGEPGDGPVVAGELPAGVDGHAISTRELDAEALGYTR